MRILIKYVCKYWQVFIDKIVNNISGSDKYE